MRRIHLVTARPPVYGQAENRLPPCEQAVAFSTSASRPFKKTDALSHFRPDRGGSAVTAASPGATTTMEKCMLQLRRIQKGYVRGYHVFHKARNRFGDEQKIVLGLFHPADGTTLGEIGLTWTDLGNGRTGVCLDAFDDAWKTLFMLRELKALTRLGPRPTPSDVEVCLKALGYRDLTDYPD
jgi:hypothetical protein